MKLRLLSTSFAIAAVGACLLVLSCETESAGGGGSLSIQPKEVTLAIGQSVTFKARGGETYAWTIEANTTNDIKNIGRLSVTTGSTTTYTALSECEEDVIIRVTSSLTTTQPNSSTSSTSTNTTPTATSYEASAIATVHHTGHGKKSGSTSSNTAAPTNTTTSNTTTSNTTTTTTTTPTTATTTTRETQPNIRIKASSKVIHETETITLTASGGSSPSGFKWEIKDSSLGFLSHTTGSSVRYTATTNQNATQYITVTYLTGSDTIAITHKVKN